MASPSLKGLLLFSSSYFRQFLTYGFDKKKRLGSQDTQDWLCKNPS